MTPTSRGIQIVHDRDRAFDAGMVRGRTTQGNRWRYSRPLETN